MIDCGNWSTLLSKIKSKKIAFINNSLHPRYLSYGDYWLDAFHALGCQVSEFRYDSISSLPSGFDLYFFIEIRYDPSQISNVHPRILYTQEERSAPFVPFFDQVFVGDPKFLLWKSAYPLQFLPNQNHLSAAQTVLNSLKITKTVPQLNTNSITDIIIPSYKNLDYLKLTIESVRKNTQDYQLIVVNSGDDERVRNYLKSQSDLILIDTPNRSSFSKSINQGLRLSKNNVVLLNNDVIVGKNWLEELKKTPFDITNPFSNCDAGWIHQYYDTVGENKLHPNMTLSQVNVNALLETESPHSEIIPRDWVAFYATYIKRKVIDATGVLDEDFLNGGEDSDYCRRASKFGFTCGHVFKSWVFHFGGKTRKVSEDENFVQHHAEDDFNNQLMQHKAKKTICVYTGAAWESWSIRNVNTTGIGGSETCAALLSAEFAKLGYRVVLIGDCEKEEGIYEGVEYLHHTKFNKFKESNYIDYFISSRTTAPLSHPIPNGLNLVWVHDIWLSQNSFIPNSEKVDKFVCLSPWHVDFFSKHHLIDKSQIVIQGNGLDVSRYQEREKIEKDPYRLIYSSSPDRGLLTLLQMFRRLKKKFPKLNLHVFYGFDNWEKAIKIRGNPIEIEHLQNIKKEMQQDGVVYHGRVPQIELAKEQMQSSLWIYPTAFTETFCLTLVECGLAGAVPLVTKVAALETTLPNDCGIKVNSVEECETMAEKLLNHPELQSSYRLNGKNYVLNTYPWEKVAQQWIQLFNS